jgi:Tfp pilus assembly protein PilN
MPLVNLIQEQRLTIRQREQQVRMLLLGVLGIGAMSFLTAGYFTFEAVRYNLNADGLVAQKEKLKPLMEELDAKEKMIAAMSPRVTTLATAQEKTAQWYAIMNHLTTNTPEGIWLSEIKCSQPLPDKPTEVSISGLSTTQESVGLFIMRLEASPDLENVQLKFTQEKQGPTTKNTQFELSANLVGSGQTTEPIEEGTKT